MAWRQGRGPFAARWPCRTAPAGRTRAREARARQRIPTPKQRGNLCGSRNNPAVTDGDPLQRSAHRRVPRVGTGLQLFPVKFGALTPKRVAYPRDNAVPRSLFRSRMIDQHAVHGAVRPVAPVIPDAIVANAGHDEEIRRHPFVDDAGRRPFLCQECRG